MCSQRLVAKQIAISEDSWASLSSSSSSGRDACSFGTNIYPFYPIWSPLCLWWHQVSARLSCWRDQSRDTIPGCCYRSGILIARYPKDGSPTRPAATSQPDPSAFSNRQWPLACRLVALLRAFLDFWSLTTPVEFVAIFGPDSYFSWTLLSVWCGALRGCVAMQFIEAIAFRISSAPPFRCHWWFLLFAPFYFGQSFCKGSRAKT